MVDFSTATQRSCVTAPASPALDPTEGKGRTLCIYLWRNNEKYSRCIIDLQILIIRTLHTCIDLYAYVIIQMHYV